MLKVTQLAGWIDGEHAIDPAGTDHVAGQPAKLTSTGWQLALDPDDYFGVFKNDMRDDIVGGPQAADEPVSGFEKAGVVIGINKVEMSKGYLQDGTTQTPWDLTPSTAWAVGQKLFVNDSGIWDNAPDDANDQALGLVTKAPADAEDTLEAIMFGPSPFHSTLT